jgi:hypothetical protein
MMVLRDGDVALPVTINDTEYENSYVCSTLTYTRYMRDELAGEEGRRRKCESRPSFEGQETPRPGEKQSKDRRWFTTQAR